MKPRTDRARIIAPPPLIALACIALGFVAKRVVTALPAFATRPRWEIFLGGLLVVIAIAMFASARRSFVDHGTYLNPYTPTRALVVTGIYRFSRNPIYVAFTLIVLAFTFFANSLWFIIAAVAAVISLHFGVVKQEEEYLSGKFGQAYRDYCARVRRWL